MIDYEILRMPALLIFSCALVVETITTVRLFGPTGSVRGWMKQWAILSVGLMTVSNVWAFIEVQQAHTLGSAIITKMLFSFVGLNLIIWALAFHMPKLWKAGW